MNTLILSPHRAVVCLTIVLVAVLFMTGCSPAAPAATPTPTDTPRVTLTISGSGSVSSLLTAVETNFEAANPGYDLSILSGSGTGGGVQGIVDGTLNVAAMARPPRDEETAQGVQ
jgi:ABC-type phosphate transport system substrate-binding protein